MTLTAHSDSPAPAGSSTAPTTVIDRATEPADVVGLAFKRLVLERHPFVRSLRIDRPVAPADLLPDGLTLERCATYESGVVALAQDARRSLLIKALTRSTIVSAAAASDMESQVLEESVRGRCQQPANPGEIPIRTWHVGSFGSYRSADRGIAAPLWHSIEANYASATREALGHLMAVTRPLGGGKLILWHGDPGTGKTTALRALVREWSPWCASQYIADPERFFADPGYITEVLTCAVPASKGPTFESPGDLTEAWRLIVAEDSDEYLRASARRDAGAGLGRLLNLTDGVLGQGFNTLILLTTNEELHQIHPALIRPGRCLARVEFARLSPMEARSWLPDQSLVPDEALTLAELYERAGQLERIGRCRPEQQPIGQYL